jgi:hypothetical protein
MTMQPIKCLLLLCIWLAAPVYAGILPIMSNINCCTLYVPEKPYTVDNKIWNESKKKKNIYMIQRSYSRRN